MEVGGSSCFNSWPWVWAAGPHCSSWLMGEGVTCDGEGGSSFADARGGWERRDAGSLGGLWEANGTHLVLIIQELPLRVLVCTASSQTPENRVQKFTAWTVGAKRSLGLSHASD